LASLEEIKHVCCTALICAVETYIMESQGIHFTYMNDMEDSLRT